MMSLWRHESIDIKFKQKFYTIFRIHENYQEDGMGHITTIMIKRTKFLNKDLKIEDMPKSWRHYDVINPWISDLGKISNYFQNP